MIEVVSQLAIWFPDGRKGDREMIQNEMTDLGERESR